MFFQKSSKGPFKSPEVLIEVDFNQCRLVNLSRITIFGATKLNVSMILK